MHSMQAIYEELHKMLRMVEHDMRNEKLILYLHGGAESSKTSGKSKKIKMGKKKISKKNSKKRKGAKPKVTREQCLQCKKSGH